MAVVETLRALGSWSMRLGAHTPQGILDQLDYFGHVTLHTGRVDPRVAGDSLLTSSRYTGVLRSIDYPDNGGCNLKGVGMAVWLGDEESKGDIFEDLITLSGLPFEDALRQLLPSAVAEGTLFNIGEQFTGTFQFATPREAIDYVCQTLGADWYVTGDGKLMAGLESDLFVVNPKAAVVRRNAGTDMALKGFSGQFQTSQDVEDFTTRVLLLAQGDGSAVAIGTADIAPGLNPYKDLHGNSVQMTRIVSESDTDQSNAQARAQLQLNRFTGTRDALSLSTSDYDIKGDVAVGDYVWVYDPDAGVIDFANEIVFRGDRMNPMRLRLIEMTWPIAKGLSVAYRDWDGNWFDLTDYLVPETGDTALVVGGYSRSLGGSSDGGVAGPRPQPNTTTPGVVQWSEPFNHSVYQSPVSGGTRAQVELRWFRPNNTDGTTILDGDHYEIRYRTATTPIFPVSIDQTAGSTLAQLNTVDEPIVYPATDWQYAYAPWENLRFHLQELTPSMPYEAQIRAVDSATPANYGDWSTLVEFQTSSDILPPATPAPPEVAASTISVQIVHRLGRADGGEFNLDRDLHHLEVHGEYESGFEPSQATLIGKMIANWGMITGEIPVVAGFQISSILPVFFKVVAVDESGNKSLPSSPVKQTADLIQDQYVQNLTVTKITAGTISADWIIGGRIATGLAGGRTQMDYAGIHGYDHLGIETVRMDNKGTFSAYSAEGDTRTQMGLLSDGRYGFAMVHPTSGALVNLTDYLFGPRSAFVDALEAIAASGYQDLATPGPSVTVEIGASRRALVMMGATLYATGASSYISLEVTGASSIVASDASKVFCQLGNGTASQISANVFAATLMDASDGLNKGTNVFKMKYRGSAGTSRFAANRSITVFPW